MPSIASTSRTVTSASTVDIAEWQAQVRASQLKASRRRRAISPQISHAYCSRLAGAAKRALRFEEYVTAHRNDDVRDVLEQIQDDPEAMAQFRAALHRRGRRLTNRYLVLNNVLGNGRNGGVRLGYDLQEDTFVAMKRYRKAYSIVGGRIQYNTQQQLYNSALRHEMWMDRKLSHLDGFLRMREVFETPRSVYYVMDVAEGTLFDLVSSENNPDMPPMSERRLRKLLLPITRGLAHAHRLGYAHRDLKLENILLVRSPTGELELRLADLEFTAFCNYDTGFDVMGSVGYMAPEVEGFMPTRQVDYRKADAWSFGVLIYAAMTGHFPFNPDYPVHQQRLVFPAHCNLSHEARDLLRRLLDKDARTRMTIVQALRHPFFRKP
jgi:serine/threonine protein kinase